jgi:heme exporter protein C
MPVPRSRAVPFTILGIAVILLIIGSYLGLAIAPPEHFMGDVQRIMYVHVPTAWSAMLVFTWAFVCAIFFLATAAWKWDNRLEAAIEVAVLFSFLLCMQGSIWAKPTWGVWWDWDPRLTTMAVLLFAFLGIAALRHFVDNPNRRATWSAVATIVGYVDVPIVYFSVRWWNSLHQQQSTAATISKEFVWPLTLNAVGILLLMIAALTLRTRVAAAHLAEEIAPPPELEPKAATLVSQPASSIA